MNPKLIEFLQFVIDNPVSISWHMSRDIDEARAAYRAATIYLAEKVRKTHPDRSVTLNNGSTVSFMVYDMERVYTHGVNLDSVLLNGVAIGTELAPMLLNATVYTY